MKKKTVNAAGRKRPWLFILYMTVLVCFTAYVMLDTFVLPSVESSSASSAYASENSKDQSSGSGSSESSDDSAVTTDTTYKDDNIQVTLTAKRVADTAVYIADVKVSDVSYLKSALAQNSYGRNIKETTSSMASSNNAVLAINGDYYGFRDYGYVLRNGTLYRSEGGDSQDLVVNSDGSFSIINESETSAESLEKAGALQVYSFGPALVNNSKILVSDSDEVAQSMNSNPRTAIGMVSPLHYVFVVSDGRTSESAGLSLKELAQVMKDAGCTVAYNLDGGGSSTMYFNGQVVNNPTGGRGGNGSSEREVSDIIYIG